MGRVGRKIPDWIRCTVPGGREYTRIKGILKKCGLHTVCTEARCPNIGECLSHGTATFMILGRICTRNCRYCAVEKGTPRSVRQDEPDNVGEAVALMGLSHAVLTSVTRDDLEDGGAGIFAGCVKAIRKSSPDCTVEVLIPDFINNFRRSIRVVIESGPDVINHNIEVTRKYFRELRPRGDYDHSLRLIQTAAVSGIPVKSGLMVGFGESLADIEATIRDLYSAGARMLTVGQYLQSTRNGFPVKKFYTPEEFRVIERCAGDAGFTVVTAGPMVRSSYRAGEVFANRGCHG